MNQAIVSVHTYERGGTPDGRKLEIKAVSEYGDMLLVSLVAESGATADYVFVPAARLEAAIRGALEGR